MEFILRDQSAFLPMRFILDNIFLTYETIHYSKQSKQPLLILKSYDKVDLGFLFMALVEMEFPSSFIHMTRLLFQGAAARVSMNGKAGGSARLYQRD
jgi:hypothetical protein